MKGRRIYVDIDDVLSETIECLIDLLEETHSRRIAVEDVQHFHLERSFGLDEEEIRDFMDRAHADEVIESIMPTEGAAEVLADWDRSGHRVNLVTGRPPSTNAASRRWLERHAIAHVSLHHLDKWNRPSWNRTGLPALPDTLTVTVSRYVPPAMRQTSPGPIASAARWIVRNGRPAEPAFASSPLGATT